MGERRKNTGIVVPVNPLVTAPASSMSAGSGDCMPSGIHGAVMEEDSLKKESSIDYPVSEGLCPEIWNRVEDGKYIFNQEIKQKALELVDKLLARYKVQARGVNVVGSICSNQYTDDSDVDIHIVVDLPEEVVLKLNSMRKIEQKAMFNGVDLLVGGRHPWEFFFQSNPYSDMGSCGCYDLMNDKWLTGPQIVPLEFDPFQEYEQSWEEAFAIGQKVQTSLFELKKNLYRRNAILEQTGKRDIYSNQSIMSVVDRRLSEIDDQIMDNMGVVVELKEQMVKLRRRAGLNPKSRDEADSMRTNKDWLTANSTFKFLQRLDVIDSCWLISELYYSVLKGEMD